jgi:hypothetical protein
LYTLKKVEQKAENIAFLAIINSPPGGLGVKQKYVQRAKKTRIPSDNKLTFRGFGGQTKVCAKSKKKLAYLDSINSLSVPHF